MNTLLPPPTMKVPAHGHILQDELPDRRLSLILATVTFIFLGLSLVLVPIPMLYFYDDGVYVLSGHRVAVGDHPYTNFYFAHPPALIWLVAAAVRLGADIYVCRMLFWFLGLLYLLLQVKFLIRLQGTTPYARPAAWLGALFLTATHLFVEASSQVLTQLPGMILVQIGFFYLLPGNLRPGRAGVLLAAASAFRIQFAYIGPAWVAYLLMTYGWSAGSRPVVRLTVAAALAACAFHAGMEFVYPNYFDCVVGSHLGREPTPITEKLRILVRLFREPQTAIGLLAVVFLFARGTGPVRGLGAFVGMEFVLTVCGSTFLSEGYFLPVYPYLYGCGAILVARLEYMYQMRTVLWIAVMLIVATSALPIAKRCYYRWMTQRPWEEELIGRVRALPGADVACTPGKIPLLAGKRLVPDYFCPDTTSPISPDFQPWFLDLARRSDIIVLTDVAISRLDREGCRALSRMGKPIVFGTHSEEDQFMHRLAPNTP